ncbi:MAG: HAMP domain-containing protein [Deltaproteobacteria bacterium]|nr:HAMP domain-containing protein [Deltaproteobacteria bacterium]
MRKIKWHTGLLGKLMSINLLVVLCAMGITWWALDSLSANYFMTLMKKFNISSEATNTMFLEAVHRYLIWAGIGAIVLATLLSLWLMRRVLRPLLSMNRLTRVMAHGDFEQRVPQGPADEIGELADSFNEMAASLQRLENLRRNMVIDVAHELRTPITNIQGYLEGIQDGVLEPDPETLDLLHEEAVRLSKLVNDLIDLARADAARFEMKTQPIDLAKLISQELKSFQSRFEQKELELKIDFPDSPALVMADSDKMRRVVANLLDNALNYTTRGAWVQISLRSENNQVTTEMANPSSTSPPLDATMVFERFYRGEKSRSRQFGGAGLGLAIVKELVQAHGSQVEAEALEGTFRIRFSLPAVAPQAALPNL